MGTVVSFEVLNYLKFALEKKLSKPAPVVLNCEVKLSFVGLLLNFVQLLSAGDCVYILLPLKSFPYFSNKRSR